MAEQCLALYEYTAKQDEELSIRKNERLKIHDSSKTWWRVENERGMIGYVPSNYCKKIEGGGGFLRKIGLGPGGGAGGGPSRAGQGPPQFNAQPQQQQFGRSEITEDAGLYHQVDLTKGSFRAAAIAKYPYEATREDELSLVKGDRVTVIEKEGDGWWNGECNGRKGWFPSNYVEEIESSARVQESNSDPTIEPAKTCICTVRALYAFQSGNHEELSFQRGDMMDIIDQPENDPDWWEAQKADGSTGLVPRNYVEIVHDAPSVRASAGVPSAAVNPGFGVQTPPATSGGTCVASQLAGALASRNGRSFESQPWFHGKISRQTCENMLNKGNDGDFLVRESESKAGDYSVSMKSPGRIKHFRIQSLPSGQYGIGQRKFLRIEDLVEHYKRAHIYTAADGTKMYLLHAYPRGY